MKIMRVGSHGPEVRELQIQLKRFEPGLVDDGRYGWRTERAVRMAQRRLGVFPPDGIAGPRTMAKMSPGPAIRHPDASTSLHRGASDLVRRAGSAIHAAGSTIANALSPADTHDIPPPIRNAVAPAARRAQKAPMTPGAASPVGVMRMSIKGRMFIIRHETQRGISNRLHHPTMGSGVTIGPGYDMKDRSSQTVAADLEDIAIDPLIAAKAAKGAGLEGSAASAFVKENRQLLDLSDAKQAALLIQIIGQYERKVQRAITVPLHQHEFDALVSYAYNPGGGWRRTTSLINTGNPAEAMVELSRHVYSRHQLVHSLVVRREAESRMFLYGEYH